ncbi:hypothetical protein BVY03_00695 [bacterium K02(2017)]|nr:hypothetical protein BVY03_00695 [bacterium K02(2017)]
MKFSFKIIFIISIMFINSACTSLGLFALNTIARQKNHYQSFTDINYASLERQALDIYQPKNNSQKADVVIFIHGGNWDFGSKDDYVFIGEALSSRGYVAVVPNYRLYPEVKFPEFVNDAAQVLSWVKSNIKQYGGNVDRVFLMGHSAGAHIAAMLALDERFIKSVGLKKRSIKGLIGLAGPYDFLPFTKDKFKIIFGPPENYHLSQPINFVDGNEAPFLLLYGKKDTTVYPKNIISLSNKINEKGGVVKVIYYEKLNHTGIISRLSIPLRKNAKILDDIVAFTKGVK